MIKRRKKTLPKSFFDAKIESLSHDGRGVTHINGKTIFISNALPGETVKFQYSRKNRAFDEGHAIEVLVPSPDRINPECNFYHICGGCSLQHLKHEKQIEHKQQVLLDQLQHFGETTPKEILSPLTSSIWGYRNKARLGVKYVIKKEKVLVGFREINGRFLADIDRCKILNDSVGKKITQLQTLIKSLEAYQNVPQIEVSIGDNQTALIFRHLIPLSEGDIKKITLFSAQNNFDSYLQPGGLETVHRIYPNDSNPLLQYSLPNHQTTIFFQPTDFTQINSHINRQMVDHAIALLNLQPEDHVLDLFCGLGNFTLPIAKYCAQATGVEGDEKMVDRAKENATQNQLNNTKFSAADLFNATLNSPWIKQTYDKILLDPPRAGAAAIVNQIDRFHAKRIVYISCNPATLARDTKILVHNHHYHLQKAGIMDMFPHTSHVESIALFIKD